MKGPAPLYRLFDELRTALSGAGVRYAMMGGIASSHWGLPHFTHDLDVAVGSTTEDAPTLLRALEGAGFIIPD